MRRTHIRVTEEERHQLQAELDRVTDVLASADHYAATPSRNYGEFDPVRDARQFIAPCDRCGTAPVFDCVRRQTETSLRPVMLWTLRCPSCGRRGQQYKSITNWNRKVYTAALDWRTFPFFLLASCADVAAAQTKIKAMQADLLLRKKQCDLRLQLGHEVGREFRERIDAYVNWSIAALTLLAKHRTAEELDA